MFVAAPQAISIFAAQVAFPGMELNFSSKMIAKRFNNAVLQHLEATELFLQEKAAEGKKILVQALLSYTMALPLDKTCAECAQVSCHGHLFLAIYNNLIHVSLLQGDLYLAKSYGQDLSKFLSHLVVTGRITTDHPAYRHYVDNIEQIDAMAAGEAGQS